VRRYQLRLRLILGMPVKSFTTTTFLLDGIVLISQGSSPTVSVYTAIFTFPRSVTTRPVHISWIVRTSCLPLGCVTSILIGPPYRLDTWVKLLPIIICLTRPAFDVYVYVQRPSSVLKLHGRKLKSSEKK
jgi:hypothetical protein